MLGIRCASRSIRSRASTLVLFQRRNYTHRPPFPPTRYEAEPDPSPENVQNQFAGHVMSAFKDMRKVVLFVAYGTLIVASTTAIAYEAAHFWIEGKMRESPGEDTRQWGWEVEHWSDLETGGTSPELGIVGRHAARAAWFSLRYGNYFTTTATISQSGSGHADGGSLNIVDASLESARLYLEKAMARVCDDQGCLRLDDVGLALLERHAAVMERLGSQIALIKARDEYLQVLHGRVGQNLAQARLSVKLGDLSERLGDGDGALTWWKRGIDLTNDETTISVTSAAVQPQTVETAAIQVAPPISDEPTSMTQLLPVQPPSTPAAQRTLVAVMLSLSAYFSKRKRLHDALDVQEHALRLIDAMVPQTNASLAKNAKHSPGQTLHRMYLLHRKSLLGLHHGEVSFALASSKVKGGTSPHLNALADLLTAASSSEVVAHILTGLSLSHPDVPSSYSGSKPNSAQGIPHPPSSDSQLLPEYRNSPALSAPAGSVLRDARLAAAEAWDLCGILYSDLGGPDDKVKSLECFERALGWVGDDPTESGSREGMGVKKWQALWARFVEAREKVLRTPS